MTNPGSSSIFETSLTANRLYSTRVSPLQCLCKFSAVFGGNGLDLPHLRSFRQRAVMSQEQLAQKSGVARDTISKLETGQRRAYPSTIRKLAAGLEVEPQLLLSDEYSRISQEAEGPS